YLKKHPYFERPSSIPPFFLSLNHARNDCLLGAGISRVSVHPFKGPGPFVILSSFIQGLRALCAILELSLYAAGFDAHWAYPFIEIVSDVDPIFSLSTIISR